MAAASLPQESRMSFREQFRATSSASPLRNGLAFLPTFCPCSQEDLSFANHLDYPGGGTTTALLLFCSSALLLFCSSALSFAACGNPTRTVSILCALFAKTPGRAVCASRTPLRDTPKSKGNGLLRPVPLASVYNRNEDTCEELS